MLDAQLPLKADIKMLETPRLRIRIDTEEAYVHAFKTGSDEWLKDYFGLASDEELASQKKKVEGGMSTYRTTVLFCHLIEKEQNVVVGSFAYHNWYPMHSRSEIGYNMKSDEYKNRGFMKEALPVMIRYGFEVMDLNRIEAFIHPENIPSRKLVEGMHFKQEGWLRQHYCMNGAMGDSLVYGLLQEDYNLVMAH